MSGSAVTATVRSPLVVAEGSLTVGHHVRDISESGNDPLLVAYLDFLAELRSSHPTSQSLRSADVEVLAIATGWAPPMVRARLEELLAAEFPNPVRLTRRTRSAAFSLFGVAVVGGALTLAATFTSPASILTASSSPSSTAASVEITSAQMIERKGPTDISGPFVIDRANLEAGKIEVGTAVTLER